MLFNSIQIQTDSEINTTVNYSLVSQFFFGYLIDLVKITQQVILTYEHHRSHYICQMLSQPNIEKYTKWSFNINVYSLKQHITQKNVSNRFVTFL